MLPHPCGGRTSIDDAKEVRRMSRKRKRTGRPRPAGTHAGKPSAARANVVWHQTAEEATLAH